jgi:hypothetical protein
VARAQARDTTTSPPGLTSPNAAHALAALTEPPNGGVPVNAITGGIALVVVLFAGTLGLTRRSMRPRARD